jgi:hypothetical protein
MAAGTGPYRTRNSGTASWRQAVRQPNPRAVGTALLPTPLDRRRGTQSFPAGGTTESLKGRPSGNREPVVAARPVAINFSPARLHRLLVMTLARRFRDPLAGTFRTSGPLPTAFPIPAALLAAASLPLLTGPIFLLRSVLRPAAGRFPTRRAAVIPSRAAGQKATPAAGVQAPPRPWLARGTLKSRSR